MTPYRAVDRQTMHASFISTVSAKAICLGIHIIYSSLEYKASSQNRIMMMGVCYMVGVNNWLSIICKRPHHHHVSYFEQQRYNDAMYKLHIVIRLIFCHNFQVLKLLLYRSLFLTPISDTSFFLWKGGHPFSHFRTFSILLQ